MAAAGRPVPTTRSIAPQPLRTSSKNPTTGHAASGAGVNRSQTDVITPSVPSEPTSSAVRS